MEVVELLKRLASPYHNTASDEEKYWRVIVNCFLADELPSFTLGTLPSYFKQYYNRAPIYDGKLSSLLQEPEFKAICHLKTIETTVTVYPTILLQSLIGGEKRARSNAEEFNSIDNGNNTNVMLPVSNQNPFAALARKEFEGSDQNYEARFGRVALEELNCGICFELLKEAVEGNCCRNIFCMACIEQNGRKCPNCRKVVGWTSNEPIRRLVGKKPVQCDFEECRAWSTVGEIEQHRVKCEFNPENWLVNCQQCHERIMRRVLAEHLRDTCVMSEAPCARCGARMIRKELPDHETQTCEYRRVLCAHGCGEHMTHKDYIANHFNTCAHQLIFCSNQACSVRVQRRLLAAHLDSCKHTQIRCPHAGRGCDVTYTREHQAGLVNHAKMCRYMLVQCPHGCGKELLKHKLKSHKCEYMPEECPACEVTVRKRDLRAHMDNHCPRRKVTCPNRCGTVTTAVLLEAHLTTCPTRQVACPKCADSIVHRDLEDHLAKLCPRNTTRCYKCHAEVYVRTMNYHLSTSCPKRVRQCDSCSQQVAAEAYNIHAARECPKRVVSCQLCNKSVKADCMAQHLINCPRRQVKCPDCNATLFANNLPRHQDTRCKRRLVACELCQQSVVCEELDEHEDYDCPCREVQCDLCDDVLFASLLPAHKLVCRCRWVSCPDCRHVCMAYLLPSHKVDRCPWRLITCPDCRRSVPAHYSLDHLSKSCPEAVVWCNLCSRKTLRKFLDSHSCPKKPLLCTICNVYVLAEDYEEHIERCGKSSCNVS